MNNIKDIINHLLHLCELVFFLILGYIILLSGVIIGKENTEFTIKSIQIHYNNALDFLLAIIFIVLLLNVLLVYIQKANKNYKTNSIGYVKSKNNSKHSKLSTSIGRLSIKIRKELFKDE